ncbi:uncharacterized protein LOC134290211, partial [Aedes albopictus]|uniref:Secreted protein n=1 Tax=Aedes albopictus TaxID=7160 RepID=A0ABM1YYN7_AEDAL
SEWNPLRIPSGILSGFRVESRVESSQDSEWNPLRIPS